jgi:hypothetical protein
MSRLTLKEKLAKIKTLPWERVDKKETKRILAIWPYFSLDPDQIACCGKYAYRKWGQKIYIVEDEKSMQFLNGLRKIGRKQNG